MDPAEKMLADKVANPSEVRVPLRHDRCGLVETKAEAFREHVANSVDPLHHEHADHRGSRNPHARFTLAPALRDPRREVSECLPAARSHPRPSIRQCLAARGPVIIDSVWDEEHDALVFDVCWALQRRAL